MRHTLLAEKIVANPQVVDILSTPVRRRIKESCWVLKKIIPGVIKNNTQWFWCQTISMYQRFLYFKQRVRYSIDTIENAPKLHARAEKSDQKIITSLRRKQSALCGLSFWGTALYRQFLLRVLLLKQWLTCRRQWRFAIVFRLALSLCFRLHFFDSALADAYVFA